MVVLAIGVADRQEFAADPCYSGGHRRHQEETARYGLRWPCSWGSAESVTAPPEPGAGTGTAASWVNVDAKKAAGRAPAVPLVSMGRSGPSLPSVDMENEAGTAAAIQHLVNRG